MKKLMILLISLVTCCALGVTSPVFAKEDTVTIENNFMARTGKESNSEKKTISETIKIQKNPKKVIVFDPGALDSLTALGLEDNIVAVPKAQNGLKMFDKKTQKIYEKSSYRDAGSLFEPNFEVVAELQPDLIMIGGRTATVQNIEQLKKAAPKAAILYTSLDVKKPFVKAVSERLNNYGDIFNKEKSVKKYNKKLAKAMSSLKKTVANKKNPSALFVMVNGGELLAQAPSGRFGWLFTDTGFTSVNKELEANTHGTPISFEYLSEKNPKYLFVLDRGATVGKKASAKSVLENDVVKETEAVKNNHVLQVNGKDWYINAGGINASLRMIKEIQTFMDK